MSQPMMVLLPQLFKFLSSIHIFGLNTVRRAYIYNVFFVLFLLSIRGKTFYILQFQKPKSGQGFESETKTLLIMRDIFIYCGMHVLNCSLHSRLSTSG